MSSADPVREKVPSKSPKAVPSKGELDRVREILFGEQIERFEAALDRSEQAIRKQVAALRDDMDRRYEELSARVDGVDTAGADAVTEVRREFDSRCDDLESTLKTALTDLRRGVMDRKKLSVLLSSLAEQVSDDSASE